MKEKKKGLSMIFGSFVLVSLLTTIFPTVPAEAVPTEKATLTMVSQFPLTTITIGFSTRQFKKWVEAWSAGQVRVDFKGGPEVIPVSELPRAVERGMFDVCFISPLFTSAQYPAFQLFNFLNPVNHRLAVRDDKVWDLMNKITRNHGMVYLGVWQAGLPAFPFLAKKPTMDDHGRIESIKGLKIRTGGPFDADLISAIGGTPVAMHPGEVYEGIRTRLIDGTMIPMNSAIDIRLWEITSYTSRDSLYDFNGMGFMNAKVFDKLSPETQKLIIEVAKEVNAAAYNYTMAITWDGFSSNTAYAKTPVLYFNDRAKQALTKARQEKLAKFAVAEPNLSSEIIANFKKYYDEEHLPLNTEASMIR